MSASSDVKKPRYLDKKIHTLSSFAHFLWTGVPPAYPIRTYIELSNACDLRCAMCGPFSALSPYRKASISKELRGFFEIEGLDNMKQILEHTIQLNCFGYGEPTIHPQFRDFLAIISEYEVLAEFFSNGMHLTDELVDQIVSSNVSMITISFSGATKEDYENVYIGGNFEKVLEGIARLAAAKKARGALFPRIAINSLGFKHHVDNLEKFVELMADHGANSILLNPVFRSFPELVAHSAVMRPWVEGKVIERAKKLAQARGLTLVSEGFERAAVKDQKGYDAAVDALARDWDPDVYGDSTPVPLQELKARARGKPQYAPEFVGVTPAKQMSMAADDGKNYDDGRIPARELGAEGLYCYEPFQTFYVAKNNTIRPCCNAVIEPGTRPLGNLRNDPAMDIWTGEGFDSLRNAIVEGQYPRMCHACVKKGTAYAENFGAVTAQSYLTWFDHVFGQRDNRLQSLCQLFDESPAPALDWALAGFGAAKYVPPARRLTEAL
jgi:MoaA/NifB/PqqE/SkfB family radical SAM enzyme